MLKVLLSTVELNGITPDTTSKYTGYIQFNFQSKWITHFSPQQDYIKPLRMPAWGSKYKQGSPNLTQLVI